MVGFSWAPIKNILCLGAHSDDIEIGCGGTLLKLAKERRKLQITWVVFSGQGRRVREARLSAEKFLTGVSDKKILFQRFQTSFFPYDGPRIKKYFERLRKSCEPDLILTHYRDDRHQDHRVLSDLAWNTWRNHLILEYEIPKYDGDMGAPNVFTELSEEICREKVTYLRKFFTTQHNKHWFSEDTFLGLMRLRGMECASATKYAEAFYCRKIVIN